MTLSLTPFEVVAEASLDHMPVTAAHVVAALGEYRVSRALEAENTGLESERYDAIVYRHTRRRR